ncbi:MAG: hypothetical protein HKP41_04840 [Desulfobacterales bacterium]|nr:hypothetical protein [Deltaproteobacteria bacterium]NNK93661.1 hypothetical protein [Desulfobacterales bacterium]
MRLQQLILHLVFILLLIPLTANAESNKDWEFELAPFYLWAINISGDVGLVGRTSSTQVEFSDVWDNLEGVFTTRFSTVYKKKFGLMVDYNYLDLGKEKDSERINLEVGFTSKILNLAGTYRVIDDKHRLDGLAGIRYISMDVSFDFPDINQDLSGDYSWTDPILGLLYRYPFNERWGLRLYGDIGGFGVGSDFTWQSVALLTYQPWENVAFALGYRALGADYVSDGSNAFTYDATTHGPLFGIDFRW